MESHKVSGKNYIIIENSQVVSIDATLSSKYHTKQLNPWPNSLASCTYGELQPVSAYPGKMEPLRDNLSTHGYLTSLRNKPQQKQPGKLSAPIPV